MINLFEYQNKEKLKTSFDELEMFLDEVWYNREKSDYFYGEEDDKVEVQQFLQFLQKSREIKSNKYVGVIHFENKRINLLPKIFYEPGREYSNNEVQTIHNHILWLLSYCRKIKFPSYNTPLDSVRSDFFEVLIYLFSKYTRKLLTNAVYQQYREIERELPYVKGRINMSRYITENLTRARWHKLNCTYDPFVLDNEFNRIIKYVSKMLLSVTTNPDSKKYLSQILFILDEVSDTRASAKKCASIRFNPALADFETVRDYCLLFLDNSISFNYKNDLKLFAFLLPMEYVFEDFIYGFIEKEVEGVKAISQSSAVHLDEDKTFQLKPDLILETEEKRIIADTKYKIVYSDEQDPKKGISQSDLYQMLSYAVRFKIDEIALFYPDTIQKYQSGHRKIRIKDQFAEDVNITIRAWQLPVIHRDLLDGLRNRNAYLGEAFQVKTDELRDRLKRILFPHIFE